MNEARKPFTLEEAIEIAEDFQDLVGTELKRMPPITYVAVGPADLEWDANYIKTIDENADTEGYQYTHENDQYDVYAIWTQPDTDIDSAVDIRTLTDASGIAYGFPA
jgi:hypothetical protein